jgi:hypothetical protein
MNPKDAFKDFISRLKLLIRKDQRLVTTTLSNIFTMRFIGNKTHGDLAEIAIAEFINQYMYDFHSVHVGKDLYRAKSQEEDITITNDITEDTFPVSLKTYGDGPLQLSTDKNFRMFPRLEKEGDQILGKEKVQNVLQDSAFVEFRERNVLCLVYDEQKNVCNILVFDYERAIADTEKIIKEEGGSKKRKYPVYRFYNSCGEYICEVRYGDAAANALQRGLWTHTRKASKYFDSITGGWINYSGNPILVKLFSHALVSSQTGHQSALEKIREDIARMKHESGLGLPCDN